MKRRQYSGNPRLGEARRAFVASMVETYTENSRLSGLYMDLGKLLIYHILHVLNARQRPDEPSSLLTQAAVEALVVGNGFASRGKVRAYLFRLCDTGCLSFEPHPFDSRKKCIVLNAALFDDEMDMWGPFLRPLSILDDDTRYQRMLTGCRETLSQVRASSLETLPLVLELLVRNPELYQLMTINCGLIILVLLVQQAIENGTDEPVVIPYTRIAQSVDLSRTHVWKVVKVLESMKMVSVDDTARTAIRVLPWAFVMLDRWLVHISAVIRAQFDRA